MSSLALGAGALVACRAGPEPGPELEPELGTAAPEPVPAEPGPTERNPDEPEPFAALEGLCADAQPIAATEFEARLEALRAQLSAASAGALIVEAGADLSYLGGPRWSRSERPLLLVVPLRGVPTLIAPAFETGTLTERMGPVELGLRSWQEHEDPYALAAAVLEAAQVGTNAVLTGASMRSFVLDGLRRAKGRGSSRSWASGGELLGRLRRRKSTAELALLRRANVATKAALRAAAGQLRPGMHEREFAEQVHAAQRAAGLERTWVLALFGQNAALPHGTSKGRELGEDDLVLVDTGGFLHGYASDITRSWAFGDAGRIDGERRRAWDTVRAAQQAVLATIAPGVACGEVDAAARRVLAEAGYDGGYGDLSHRLGHGIGLEVHEGPYLVGGNQRRLEVGNTMSNEPGIYRPGAFGIRLEDIVAVTEDGVEVFGEQPSSLDSPFG